MFTLGNEFFQLVSQTLLKVQQTQAGAMDQFASWVADSLKNDGVLHVFGAGHAYLVAEDIYFRGGGLAPVNAIQDIDYTTLGGGSPTRHIQLERLEGYARIVLNNYDLRPGEVLVVVSQSGINPAPVEAALEGKARQLRVVALTSLEHSQASQSRHSSGKRLYEIADLVIDNCIPHGDACMEIAPGLPKTSPLSTIIHCSILQAMVAEVALRLHQAGIEPPILVAHNLPGYQAAFDRTMQKFGGRRQKNY